MTEFYNWFNQNLTVGQFPYTVNKSFNATNYDIVINVSDEYYPEIEERINRFGCKQYWFPMNECTHNIGLNSIYGAMVILNEAQQQNLKVYLHCNAGVTRSRIVYQAYHFMKTREHLVNEVGQHTNMLLKHCTCEYLPSKQEMEGYLLLINQYLQKGMDGGMLDMAKLSAIKSFWVAKK